MRHPQVLQVLRCGIPKPTATGLISERACTSPAAFPRTCSWAFQQLFILTLCCRAVQAGAAQAEVRAAWRGGAHRHVRGHARLFPPHLHFLQHCPEALQPGKLLLQCPESNVVDSEAVRATAVHCSVQPRWNSQHRARSRVMRNNCNIKWCACMQGMLLASGFNQPESLAAFSLAAHEDPNSAMAEWGIAYALGPGANRCPSTVHPAQCAGYGQAP